MSDSGCSVTYVQNTIPSPGLCFQSHRQTIGGHLSSGGSVFFMFYCKQESVEMTTAQSDSTMSPADVTCTSHVCVSVCSFADVDALVADQVSQHREALAALGAAVGSLPGVDGLVHLETAGLREALPAQAAAVALLPRVHAHVSLDVAGLGEAPAALSAAERFLPGVHPLVGFQLVRVDEGLLAEGAVVDLLPGVGALVHQQVSGGGEEARALLAAERPFYPAGKASAP